MRRRQNEKEHLERPVRSSGPAGRGGGAVAFARRGGPGRGARLPYLCIGVGCGLFGQGAGELLAARAVKGDPALQRRLEVERADERNRAIADRAKGKAFDRMTFVYGALMLTFALMEVELAAVLLLVAAYLFVEFSVVYYRCKLEKQM